MFVFVFLWLASHRPHIASSRGDSTPPRAPKSAFGGAHRPVSLSPSDSAHKMTPNPTDEALQGGHVEA
eukprot:14291942-Alexandrium_andersonii.AAC.1